MRSGAKASVALSLGVLAVLALMAWAMPGPVPVPHPETETAPGPEATAKPASVDRPVVLPPPPETAQRPEAAPRQVVEALPAEPPEPEPPEPAPRAVKQITALRARPEPAAIRVEAEPATETVTASVEVVREGRTLLRLLEHGSGPEIELAWPDSAARRARLYRRLRDCYGVRVALMDGRDRLFAARGTPGAAWDLNLDLYSGFIRRPAGRLAQGEAEAAARIRAYHGGLAGARPVRVFPRRVDALLLGGLNRIVGPGYAERRTIRARYRLDGARLLVERVEADGHALPGRIDLSAAARRACRRAAS
ncbi:MAG: hypothetical protein IID48_02340 [Proteobacteria bacterium]|nr:hypothetical protein [Pseudomonadota bacterium]